MHAVTSVTRTKPCHAAVRLTLTAQTYLEVSVTLRASNAFNLSHLFFLFFFFSKKYLAENVTDMYRKVMVGDVARKYKYKRKKIKI